MKALSRLSVILFTLCLILLSISLPVLFISTSKSYYKSQLIQCNSYPAKNDYLYVRYIGGDRNKVARFTDTQVDSIIEHITSFLSDEKESFALQMDAVVLNGTIRNGVDIFSTEAVEHMFDVKLLFLNVKQITYIICLIFFICGIFIFYNRNEIKKYIFKYSLCSLLGLLSAVVLFLLFVFFKSSSPDLFFSTLWEYMHHIFFPFSPDKFSNSFFNDTLTMILNLEFFMNTVKTVVLVLCSSCIVYLVSTFLIQKFLSKK